jgi:nucleoside 2-deoxyribosyltransferase
MTIKKLYIAGPYSARPNSPDSYHEIQANIMRASAAAAEAIRAGWSPFTPHKNTAGFEALGVPNERFIEMDLVWLEHADAILMIGEWERSKGALREISRARELGIPVLEIDAYGRIPDAGIMR